MIGAPRLRALSRSAVAKLAPRLGYDVVPRGYYSVVPDVSELSEDTFSRRSELHGIDFDTQAQIDFARRELTPFIRELGASAHPWTPDYRPYGAVDGEVLFAMLRHLRPARVVELGSGHTTYVMAAALRKNAAEGSPASFVAYDPFPEALAARQVGGLNALHEVRAQDVPDSVFLELRAGDVLFVDTTHTVKIGGDVNRVVLDILPQLAPGVVVHFHDIFLPGEYHRAWIEKGWLWAEQYLLQAFLSLNRNFEVVFAAAGIWSDHPDALREIVPSLRDHRPSSFWIRRVVD
jgi:predicted O-methyltransferase YrrM